MCNGNGSAEGYSSERLGGGGRSEGRYGGITLLRRGGLGHGGVV